jgi:hypothetical protein
MSGAPACGDAPTRSSRRMKSVVAAERGAFATYRGASAVAVRASTSGMPAFMRRLKSANSADKSLLFPSEGAAACTRPARWRKGCGRPLCDGLPHTALRRAETRAAAQRAAILL